MMNFWKNQLKKAKQIIFQPQIIYGKSNFKRKKFKCSWHKSSDLRIGLKAEKNNTFYQLYFPKKCFWKTKNNNFKICINPKKDYYVRKISEGKCLKTKILGHDLLLSLSKKTWKNILKFLRNIKSTWALLLDFYPKQFATWLISGLYFQELKKQFESWNHANEMVWEWEFWKCWTQKILLYKGYKNEFITKKQQLKPRRE